mmetsp:Transcript_27499/g.84373  ORF Transcript_27499/g.84373 Transcript_27499/m.84373 type:complete len:253 (-) Transcript_27499:497-1255(-)
MLMQKLSVVVVVALTVRPALGGIEIRQVGCQDLGYCHGHGRCVSATRGSPTMTCDCFDGWGSAKDTAIDKMLDCSQRTCLAGIATSDLPRSATDAHPARECSGNGLCDRETGRCLCFPSWEGSACERRACPRACSGHGQCVSMLELATLEDALPLQNRSNTSSYTRPWDRRIGVACHCDSSWPVGPGQRQEPEFFGPDCSQRHCPSQSTLSGGCTNASICHVDCSNRGRCDHKLGECSCFPPYAGSACERRR